MPDPDRATLPEYTTRAVSRPDGAGAAVEFASARNVRHKARLSGMNPNYWYPAEWSENLRPGGHIATSFWSAPIALFRTEAGEPAAIADRCPHRHLPLTMGKVDGCALVCAYHGWAFGRDGALTSVNHDEFGHGVLKLGVRAYPVRERYGLVWIFPGDPALADSVPLPEIANAEGEDEWAHMHFDFVWKSHHSMVIDNLCNLTHLHVHGDLVPFDKTWLAHSRLDGEAIEMVWNHTFRPSLAAPLFSVFTGRSKIDGRSATRSVYSYPYHASDSGGVRAINLMLPLGPALTRVFTLYQYRTLAVPGLSRARRLSLMRKLVVPLFRRGSIEVYRQDGVTVEAEMQRLGENFFEPTPEYNPVVNLFDRLNAERWQAWLDYRAGERQVSCGVKRLDGVIASYTEDTTYCRPAEDATTLRAAG